jgi:hypothetical protein
VTVEPGGQRYRASVSRLGRVRPARVLVVAESLRSVEESVRCVLVLLLLAGPAALAGTALGRLVAGARGRGGRWSA